MFHHRHQDLVVMVWMALLLLQPFLSLVVVDAVADLDGYVDPTYNCPATTTCPQLCVASLDECPIEMTCTSTGDNNNNNNNNNSNATVLCADGICRESEFACTLERGGDNNNPCAHMACGRTVACRADVITTYDVCVRSQPLYELMAAGVVSSDDCASSTTGSTRNLVEANSTTDGSSDEQPSKASSFGVDPLSWSDIGPTSGNPDDTESVMGWDGPGQITGYVWVSLVTLGRIVWCWYNNRWAPVFGSTKLLQLRMETHIRNDPDAHVAHLYQTGYRNNHPVGKLLYVATILTFFGWYILLSITTYEGYQKDLTDEQIVRMLQAYCLVFNLGFFWNLALYWPYSIASVFYRRCRLKEAKQVCVHYYASLETTTGIQSSVFKSTTSLLSQMDGSVKLQNETEQTRQTIDQTIHPISRIVSKAMGLIYADKPVQEYVDMTVDDYRDVDFNNTHKDVMVECCPVHTNPDDGTRYFVFLFRRYTYDDKTGKFLPGTLSVGRRFSEMKPQQQQQQPQQQQGGATDDIHIMEDSTAATTTTTTSDQPPKQSPAASHSPRCIFTGLSQQEVDKRTSIVGPNKIEMNQPSLWKIFRQEISKPFYLYQFQILWIWVTIQYWYMMIANQLVIFCSATLISWFRYRSGMVLYELSCITGTIQVLRNQQWQELDQSNVVPGDIVQLEPGIIHCDMVLLTGNVIVDESALTGEAIAHSKLPIDTTSEELYDPTIHKRQTLSAGTRIVETPTTKTPAAAAAEGDASASGSGSACGGLGPMALVTKTASYTRKGELLREVIAFRKYPVQYEVDLPYAIFILGLFCVVLWFIVFFKSSSTPVVAWYLGLVAVSNALPPLLPISFTVPLGYSLERLSKNRVVCSKSDCILTAGEVTKVFFDKTGTLTKQGLDYTDCHSVEKSKFVQSVSDVMSIAMASCHTLVKSYRDGSLIGNTIDQAMFVASQADIILEEEKSCSMNASNKQHAATTIAQKDGKKIEVLRRFDFDHFLMTQSVIVRLDDGSVMVIAKGSGEAIQDICHVATVPQDFEERLEESSRVGAYQIAVAFKRLPSACKDMIAALKRDQVEEDMTLAGILSFSNELRDNTSNVIGDLVEADIQPVMLTGDNLYTGLHIAREIGIIANRETKVTLGVIEDVGLEATWLTEDNECAEAPLVEELEQSAGGSIIAMSGEAWRFVLKSQPTYASSIAPFIRVVGRCSPHDKVSIVDTFVGLGHTTMMCGDGGNDCGALRAAHVGVALSDGDASLVSPFTSLEKDIESVLTVVKEGRAALHSTLAVYRYIILYGNITSYCQVITYYLKASLTGEQWTFLDGVWTVLFSLTLPLAKPAYKLAKTCPTASLLSPQTVLSITGIIILNYAFMLWALCSLYSKDWFQCRQWNADKVLVQNISLSADNYETQVVFLVVAAQCIAAAIACNFGYEFRQTWYRNYLFVLIAVSAITIQVYITLVPSPLSCFFRVNCQNEDIVGGIIESEPQPINNPFNTTVMPIEFRYEILAITVVNGVAVALYDYFVVNGIRRTQNTDKKPNNDSMVGKNNYQLFPRKKRSPFTSSIVKKGRKSKGATSFTTDLALESESFRPQKESAVDHA